MPILTNSKGLKALVGAGLLAGGLAIAKSNYSKTDYSSQEKEPGGTSTAPEGSTKQYDQAALPPNVTPGWRVRVCSEKTKAQAIRFLISNPATKSSSSMGARPNEGMGTDQASSSKGSGGTGETGMSGNMAPELAEWKRGESSEIKLPESFQLADKIRVEAMPDQKDKKAAVCILYNDHVVKHLNFDDHEVTTMNQSEHGECGC